MVTKHTSLFYPQKIEGMIRTCEDRSHPAHPYCVGLADGIFEVVEFVSVENIVCERFQAYSVYPRDGGIVGGHGITLGNLYKYS